MMTRTPLSEIAEADPKKLSSAVPGPGDGSPGHSLDGKPRSLPGSRLHPSPTPWPREENPFARFFESHPHADPARNTRIVRPAPLQVVQPLPPLPPAPVLPPLVSNAPARPHFLKRPLQICLVLLAVLLMAVPFLPGPARRVFYDFWPQPSARSVRVAPLRPVDYQFISSPFGLRGGRPHQGVDLAAPSGAPIYAMASGRVVYSGWEAGYGQSIVLDHGNGIRTRYAHCSSLLALTGRRVRQGSIIAKVGSTGHSTGPHLHFEVIVKGIHKNPAWYYAFP